MQYVRHLLHCYGMLPYSVRAQSYVTAVQYPQ